MKDREGVESRAALLDEGSPSGYGCLRGGAFSCRRVSGTFALGADVRRYEVVPRLSTLCEQRRQYLHV